MTCTTHTHIIFNCTYSNRNTTASDIGVIRVRKSQYTYQMYKLIKSHGVSMGKK